MKTYLNLSLFDTLSKETVMVCTCSNITISSKSN